MRSLGISISKLAIYGIFLNYYCYYIIRGSFIPMGTYLFFGLAIVGIMITSLNDPLRIDSDIKCFIWYGIISLITVFLAASSSYAIDGLFKYFQRIILIFLITHICEREKSITFAIRVMAVTAVACAAASLMSMNDYSQKFSVESGASISTNDIGSIMAFGCFAILFAFGAGKGGKVYKTILKVAYIIAAISVISVTGSRKSLIAIIIIFALMFIFCWSDYFKNMTSLQFLSIIIISAIAIYVVATYLWPYFEDTNLYVRVFGRGAERTAESDESRIELYRMAFKEFLNHPLFGIGFNNYAYYYGSYTHSTYVEPLACSGLFGLLYLFPYVHILINQIKLSFSHENEYSTENRVFQKEMLAFYIAFLFVGIGIPYIYKDIPCIIFAMFIALQNISLNANKSNELTNHQ